MGYKFILPFLFCLISYQGAFSQDEKLPSLIFEGAPRTLDGEIIADRSSNRLPDGELAAGLVVNTNLTGLVFEVEKGIQKINQNPGEYFLYLSPNTRVISIHKSGYKTRTIVFSDAGINLEAGKVWSINVIGEKRQQKNRLNENIPVRIGISPKGATLNILDHDFSKVVNSEYTELTLDKGEYAIEIKRDRHKTIYDRISILDNKINEFYYEMELSKQAKQADTILALVLTAVSVLIYIVINK